MFRLGTWFVHVTHTRQIQRKSQLIQTWVITCPVQICEKIGSIEEKSCYALDSLNKDQIMTSADVTTWNKSWEMHGW